MPQEFRNGRVHGRRAPFIAKKDQMLGRTALWVVLRLCRMGGTFTSSSWECHRRIKCAFSLFCSFSLFVILGQNGPLLEKRVWIGIFWPAGKGDPDSGLLVPSCALCFFVHRCVTVRFGVLTLFSVHRRGPVAVPWSGIFTLVNPSRAITLRFSCKPWVLSFLCVRIHRPDSTTFPTFVSRIVLMFLSFCQMDSQNTLTMPSTTKGRLFNSLIVFSAVSWGRCNFWHCSNCSNWVTAGDHKSRPHCCWNVSQSSA